jgi:DNA-binding LacI/PurR family transcriptional regulator
MPARQIGAIAVDTLINQMKTGELPVPAGHMIDFAIRIRKSVARV